MTDSVKEEVPGADSHRAGDFLRLWEQPGTLTVDVKDRRAVRMGLSAHSAYGKAGRKGPYIIKLPFLRGGEGLKQAVGPG